MATVKRFEIRSDEELMHETSVLKFPYNGQFTLSSKLMKPSYLVQMWSNLVLSTELITQIGHCKEFKS